MCQPPAQRRAPVGRPRTLRLTAGSRQKYVTRAQALLNGRDDTSTHLHLVDMEVKLVEFVNVMVISERAAKLSDIP